jgi:hypothetical protein
MNAANTQTLHLCPGIVIGHRFSPTYVNRTITLTSSAGAQLASICRYPADVPSDVAYASETCTLDIVRPVLKAWTQTNPGGTHEDFERRARMLQEIEGMEIVEPGDMAGEAAPQGESYLRSMHNTAMRTWSWDGEAWCSDGWSQTQTHSWGRITFATFVRSAHPTCDIYLFPNAGILRSESNQGPGITIQDGKVVITLTDGRLMAPAEDPRADHVYRPTEAQQSWLCDHGLAEAVADESVWTVKALSEECWAP